MGQRDFMSKIKARWAEGHFVCVGLDTDPYKLPACADRQYVEQKIFDFNQAIIMAMEGVGIVGAYKLNSAFYEAFGRCGITALQRTCEFIRTRYPEIPIILDAKRADIGDTNKAYVQFAYGYCGADAITVHPYLGKEALKPFLERTDKGVIVLCRTSNKGAGEFQDLRDDQGDPLYMRVARNVAESWNEGGNCALVTGGTYPDEIGKIRGVAPDLPLLIPGIGKQGGDLVNSVRNGRNSRDQGFLINSSSGIIYASSGEDFAEKAAAAALKLHNEIQAALIPFSGAQG